jgi:endonuclease-3
MPRTRPTSTDPRAHARRVVKALGRLYPESRCALEHRGAYQLLVATILSAQCTDARVNQVTPALFARYPDPASLAQSESGELEALIHSTGFFRAKAKNLRAMAARVVEAHGGEVPGDLDALTALPGVGRKTANVVLGNAFDVASGVVVDTHVKRLAYRLGLTDGRDPKAIERDLMAVVPRKEWVDLSHRLIEHGRKVCVARKPRCSACGLATLCPKRGVTSAA